MVCALYIPEVEFANVSTMEPIVLQSVPHERYNKVTKCIFAGVCHRNIHVKWGSSLWIEMNVPVCLWVQTCYICEEQGRESKAATGACMTCNKHGCRQAFHVTWWDMSDDQSVPVFSHQNGGFTNKHFILSFKFSIANLMFFFLFFVSSVPSLQGCYVKNKAQMQIMSNTVDIANTITANW